MLLLAAYWLAMRMTAKEATNLFLRFVTGTLWTGLRCCFYLWISDFRGKWNAAVVTLKNPLISAKSKQNLDSFKIHEDNVWTRLDYQRFAFFNPPTLSCLLVSAHLTVLSPPVLFRVLGLRISLSSMLTICPNFGRSALSRCQQSSMSWWSATGQSMGGGSR